MLLGTQNPAKFARYKTILDEIPGLEVVSPAAIGVNFAIAEDGASAEANAWIKAHAYMRQFGLPALSVDEALYIDAFPPGDQPGTHVRRLLGRDASDDELLFAFLERPKHLSPEERGVTWIYAVCLALPDGREFHDEVDIPAVLIDRAVLPVLPGYPLSSILFSTEIGKVHRDPLLVEQHAIGRDDGDHPMVAGMFEELEEGGVEQRLAAGDAHHVVPKFTRLGQPPFRSATGSSCRS